MAASVITGTEQPAENLSPEEFLLSGNAPGNSPLLEQISVGSDFLTEFWKEKYLLEYIQEGGSKIKFITGRPGSGKSHILQMFSRIADSQNYKTVNFSANDIWLHDFKENRELMDNDNAGIKSYQALWMRIQNEIVGQRFNRFADITDLDRMAAQIYTPQLLTVMSQKFSEVFTSMGRKAAAIDTAAAEELPGKAMLGGVGLPRLVLEATLESETGGVEDV